MSRLTSWRLALRLAAREALRARGRSVLVLVMIALPVLAVTAADVVMRTSDVNSVESLDRRLGSAEAQVDVPAGGRPVLQSFDPQLGFGSVGGGGGRPEMPTADRLSAALGGARMIPMRSGDADLRTDNGIGYASALEVDLRDPLTRGLVDLRGGRLPSGPHEVVVNQAVLDKGYAIGDVLDLARGKLTDPTIVGLAESAQVRTYPAVAGPVGSLGIRSGSGPSWLVGGGPVDWPTVRELNALGAQVTSRAVIADPPPESELPAQVRGMDQGTDDATVAVVVLVVVMALLEVVLLAGPAFAVSARRLSRSLALMAAAGGTPAQSRRVVLAGGVVLGGLAAVLGVVLGVLAGWAVLPLVQRWSSSWFGPFEVPWPHLAGVAAFGLLSALLAAVVPAWIASRQDPVAVLAGRRADRPVSRRSPLLGLVLVGLGVVGAAYGARASQNGEFAIAGSAVVAVLGMILLVPVVVAAVARASGRLPLALRYAARDAARHRTRTVPAVAAVAATVAGVVALGIGTSSDAAENEGTYVQQLPLGTGLVTAYGRHPDWDALRSAAQAKLPGATVTPVRGVPESLPGGWVDLRFRDADGSVALQSYSSTSGASVVVAAGGVATFAPTLDSTVADTADRVLADGGAVVFTDEGAPGRREVVMTATVHQRKAPRTPPLRGALDALVVRVSGSGAGARAILSPAAASTVGLHPETVGLLVGGGPVTKRQETDAGEAVTAVSRNAGFYVERGYQADDATVIAQLVLAGLGGVLMLGGTLTATFLALSDARPDLATLSAIGASPRRRRWIAAGYALVVGLVGAVLGAAVGFIPGLAVTYPLTRGYGPTPAHYLDVPWLLVIGLVLALPLVTAVIVGLSARSRLPLVARLD